MATVDPQDLPGPPLRPVGTAEADFRRARLEARQSLRETRRLIEERRAREAAARKGGAL